MLRRIRLFLVLGIVLAAAGAGWVFLHDRPPSGESTRGLDALRVPEGFTVEMVAGPELVTYPMFAALDDAGRLFLCESSGKALTDEEMAANPQYRVSVLEDRDGDGIFDTSRVFADRLTISQGAVWHRGSLYVASPPDFYRFEDTDGDGVSDVREVILSGFPMKSNAATLHGPFLGPDGWLYLAHGNSKPFRIETPEGTVVEGKGSRIWRARPDGTGLEWITAGGHDNPVEVVFTPSGEPFATSTYFQNPKGGLRDAIFHLVEGGIYPKYTQVVEQFQRTGDLMPVMTRMGRVAPSGLIRYESGAFGQEYRGNLFSAQFNPHRVQRHRLYREGATFRTEDEDFLTSLDPEVHFTDLVEDVDGSLLVVDTGAWFIKGCPVSRVSRPEFEGAIYRIRKLNAHKIDDPRGRRLNLDQQSPHSLATHLQDARVFVRKKALELLVEAGSVAPLSQVLSTSKSPEVRCAVIFGLYRIGGPEALEACQSALQDRDFTVRIAAVRVLGMLRDPQSVEVLMALVQKGEAPVRRQAATALGQIGDPRAVPALLQAAADPSDRMVEHSIIFSLLSLKQTAPLVAALRSSSPKVQKAALIALDQMEGRPLRKEHLLTFLASPESELREAAFWVAGHHPEWAADAVEFLRPRLAAGPSDDDREALSRIFTAFSGDPKVQKIITGALATGTPSQKIFLLGVIDGSPVKELPDAWLEQLRLRLQDPEDGVRARCTDLIKSHKLSGFQSELEAIAANPEESDDLCVAAMDALVGSHPTLPREYFDFLSARLNTATPAPLRLAAGRVIGRARLDDTQLLELARKELPQADPLVFPNLLDAFASSQSPEVGRALLDTLLKKPHALDSYARERVDELFEKFPEDVRKETQVLTKRLDEIKQARVGRLMELDRQLREGNVERGRKLFFGQVAGCSSCHTIGAEGHEVGPDLTSVGAVRSRHDLLEAIIFPSASFVPGHEVRRVQTSRERHSGILGGWERSAAVDSDSDVLILVTGPNARVRIPRSEIVSMEASPVSLMPEGLGEALSRDQLADILAFLQAQKQLSDQSIGTTPERD